MSRLDREVLEGIHDALTDSIVARLKEAKDDPPNKALTASEVTAFAKFLKDNNITANLATSPVGRNVLEGLPFGFENEHEEVA